MTSSRFHPIFRLVGALLLVAICRPSAGAEPAALPNVSQLGAPVRNETRQFRRFVKSWTDLKKDNVVMQQRDYSCGAAALATLMRYHWGDKVTETQLLIETVEMLTVEEMKERIKNGLSLTDLRRLAVRMGYLASIGELTFDKLRESKVPVVVGIVVNKFDHFVVYRGTDGQYVYLADPARGNVRVPVQEFLDQWQKNLVLVAVPQNVKDVERQSPLLVQPEEMLLGESNRQYLRNRVTAARSATVP